MNSNALYVSLVFVMGVSLGVSLNTEIVHEVVIPEPIEKIDTSKFLTVDDLAAIYNCMDVKIANKQNGLKFPCIVVRGDSF